MTTAELSRALRDPSLRTEDVCRQAAHILAELAARTESIPLMAVSGSTVRLPQLQSSVVWLDDPEMMPEVVTYEVADLAPGEYRVVDRLDTLVIVHRVGHANDGG